MENNYSETSVLRRRSPTNTGLSTEVVSLLSWNIYIEKKLQKTGLCICGFKNEVIFFLKMSLSEVLLLWFLNMKVSKKFETIKCTQLFFKTT